MSEHRIYRVELTQEQYDRAVVLVASDRQLVNRFNDVHLSPNVYRSDGLTDAERNMIDDREPGALPPHISF